jgi:hypothetical protein
VCQNGELVKIGAAAMDDVCVIPNGTMIIGLDAFTTLALTNNWRRNTPTLRSSTILTPRERNQGDAAS